jgi:hypothetical protein
VRWRAFFSFFFCLFFCLFPPFVRVFSDVKTVLDVETHAKMIALLKIVVFPPAAADYSDDPIGTNAHVEAYLHGPDLLPAHFQPEPLFEPVLPRTRVLGGASADVRVASGGR